MTYTALVRLANYRSWTESLGYDREWIIQITQSRIYHDLQLISKEFEGIALPMRYDVQVVLLPPTTPINSFISKLNDVAVRWAPIKVEVDIYCGLPHEILNNGGMGECSHREMCVAHLDLNNFTSKSIYEGFYQPYIEVLGMSSRLAFKLMGKAVVQYLGGDNIVVVTYPQNIDDLLAEVVEEDIKVGIGISESPRKAFELAAKALNVLRNERKNFKYLIIRG